MYTAYDRDKQEQQFNSMVPGAPGVIGYGSAAILSGYGLHRLNSFAKGQYETHGSDIQNWVAKHILDGAAVKDLPEYSTLTGKVMKKGMSMMWGNRLTSSVGAYNAKTKRFGGTKYDWILGEGKDAKGSLKPTAEWMAFQEKKVAAYNHWNMANYKVAGEGGATHASWFFGKKSKVAAGEIYATRRKLPGLGFAAFGLMTINSELEARGDMSGIATGMIREGASILGAKSLGTLGMLAGAALGPVGAFIGGAVGTIAGGMAGYGSLDVVQKMASLGHQWSTPDTGGGYRDSAMGMTMRERSLNAIRTSQFNVRAGFGGEAMRLATGR